MATKKMKFSAKEVEASNKDAVITALMELQVNAHESQASRSRMASALSGGNDNADTLHNIFIDYGYPQELGFSNFWNMYRRFGVAKRVVELYPDQTWLDDPIVKSKSSEDSDSDTQTAFEKDLEKLVEKMGLWRRLRGLDTRQRVGRYAGMFMRVRDNNPPHEPIVGTLSGIDSLADMIPLYESQLVVLTTEDDAQSDDFGMPTMYQFNGGAVGDRDEKSSQSFSIHPSRVVISAEGSDNNGIYGVPVLESIYNSLMDLRKIMGGGGEGFYKNAAQSIIHTMNDKQSLKGVGDMLEGLNDQTNDFVRNRFNRSLVSPMDTKTLESHLISPLDFANVSLMDVSAGAATPATLIIGNQTGRLAGDQDTKGFLGLVQARREDFGTQTVTDVIDWFMLFGILPTDDYVVEWDDALEMSTGEKLESADKMAEINNKQFLSGGEIPFSGDEVREAGGLDILTMPDIEIPSETIIDEGEL